VHIGVDWLARTELGGAILYAGLQAEKSALVAINTTFSAAAAALTAAVITRIRFRKPDASLIANGWMAGWSQAALVAPHSNLRPRS